MTLKYSDDFNSPNTVYFILKWELYGSVLWLHDWSMYNECWKMLRWNIFHLDHNRILIFLEQNKFSKNKMFEENRTVIHICYWANTFYQPWYEIVDEQELFVKATRIKCSENKYCAIWNRFYSILPYVSGSIFTIGCIHSIATKMLSKFDKLIQQTFEIITLITNDKVLFADSFHCKKINWYGEV